MPASIVAQAIYIIDSYPLLQGACPEIIQRETKPNVCRKNPEKIKNFSIAISLVNILEFELKIWKNNIVKRTNPKNK